MRILTIAAAVLTTAAGSSAAFAAEARLSDSQFVKVAHCRGLSTGDRAATLDAILKVQKRSRADYILDKADNARSEGARLVRTDAQAAQAALADCDKFGA